MKSIRGRPGLLAVTLLCLALPSARGQLEGGTLPSCNLGAFSGEGAPNLAACAGRLLLLEFFAYW